MAKAEKTMKNKLRMYKLFTETIFQLMRRQLRSKKRVPNRFFGIRDLAFLKVGIRDFSGKERRYSGLELRVGTRDFKILRSGMRKMLL